MDKQAAEARKLAKELPLNEKISHIWTYYKWWIIGILAGVLIVAGTAYEILTQPKYDLEISYFSDAPVSDDVIASMEDYFAQFAEDTDGNGIVNVKIYNSSMSMAGNDPSYQMAIQSKLVAELASKSYPVYIFDDLFAEMVNQDSFKDSFDELVDMSEIPELKSAFGINDDSHLYWATRTVFPAEEDDEDRINQYNTIKSIEESALVNKK